MLAAAVSASHQACCNSWLPQCSRIFILVPRPNPSGLSTFDSVTHPFWCTCGGDEGIDMRETLYILICVCLCVHIMGVYRTLDLGSATTVMPRMSPAKSRTPVVMLSLEPRRDTDKTHRCHVLWRKVWLRHIAISRTDGSADAAEVRQSAVLHAHVLRQCASHRLREHHDPSWQDCKCVICVRCLCRGQFCTCNRCLSRWTHHRSSLMLFDIDPSKPVLPALALE